MADMHGRLEHDLPEYRASAPRTRVQVFRDGDRWVWYHACGEARTWFHWETALLGGIAHAGRCSR